MAGLAAGRRRLCLCLLYTADAAEDRLWGDLGGVGIYNIHVEWQITLDAVIE